MKRHSLLVPLLVAGLLLALGAGASAQGPVPQAALGTGFTYQGRLTDGGSPANGLYDFEVRCYE